MSMPECTGGELWMGTSGVYVGRSVVYLGTRETLKYYTTHLFLFYDRCSEWMRVEEMEAYEAAELLREYRRIV